MTGGILGGYWWPLVVTAAPPLPQPRWLRWGFGGGEGPGAPPEPAPPPKPGRGPPEEPPEYAEIRVK